MSDLIDRQAITEHIRNRIDMQDLYLPIHIIQLIDELPTIDAVPVVRCKDCRWSRGFATFACPMVGRVNLKDDDFCSRGERRADETD